MSSYLLDITLVFSVRPWKGRMLAHDRNFVSGEKYEGLTKSGLAMRGDVLMSVIDALTRLKHRARALGRLWARQLGYVTCCR
jgi:hypothetical protein